MKFSKIQIRKALSQFGKREYIPNDDFTTVKVTTESTSNTGEVMPEWYLKSVFGITFQQTVVHRPQETKAVMDNVAQSIFNALYMDIISHLYAIKHECIHGDREDIIGLLTKLINRIEVDNGNHDNL